MNELTSANTHLCPNPNDSFTTTVSAKKSKPRLACEASLAPILLVPPRVRFIGRIRRLRIGKLMLTGILTLISKVDSSCLHSLVDQRKVIPCSVMAGQRSVRTPDVRANLVEVYKEDVMRPWMKLLAIGGVVGVALGVSMAGEKPADRRVPAPIKTSRPGRLEFFSRGGAPDEQAAAAAKALADPVAEELAAEVSAAPKRFTRSKIELADELDAKKITRHLNAETIGDEPVEKSPTKTTLKPAKTLNGSTGNLSEVKLNTRAAKVPLKPIADVELLPPPRDSRCCHSASSQA